MSARTAIACFGEALIDFLAEPGAAGAPRRFVEQAGGAPANVAVGIARLGGEARFIGMLSTDMFGDVLAAQFAAHGVDTRGVKRTDAARTALAFVQLGADGERSFNFYRPPAADLLFRADDFDPAWFADLAVFHTCSNSLTAPEIADATLHGMRLARRAGTLVSFDLNLRPALWPRDLDPLPALWPALERAHLVKLSGEELAYLARDADEALVVECLLAAEARVVIVTDGAAPVRWWTRTASGAVATRAVTALDTTAAGDAFVAGLLRRVVAHALTPDTLAAAFADPETREDLLGFAAATGAFAVTRHGAFAAMPTVAEARAVMGRAATVAP